MSIYNLYNTNISLNHQSLSTFNPIETDPEIEILQNLKMSHKEISLGQYKSSIDVEDLESTHRRSEKIGLIQSQSEGEDTQVLAEETLMLRELFSQIDRDGSGALSASELLAFGDQLGVSSAAVRQMMIEADDDGDGEIDFEEFCLLFRRGDPNAPWKQIKKLHRHRFSNDPLSYVRLSQTADSSLQTGPGGWAPKIASYEEELYQIVSTVPTSTMYVNHGVEESNLERVKELLIKGARPNSRASNGKETVVMLATLNCHSKILGVLVGHMSADLDLIEPETGTFCKFEQKYDT